MYPVSQTFIDEANAQTRDVYTRIVLEASSENLTDRTVTLDSDKIIDFTIDYPFDDNERPIFGQALSASASFRIMNPNLEAYFATGSVVVKPYIGFPSARDEGGEVTNVEYMPLGAFIAYDTTSTDNFTTLTVSAYDGIAFTDVPFDWHPESSSPYSMTLEDLTDLICERFNFTLNPNTVFPVTQFGDPVRVQPMRDGDNNDIVNTGREWLGWIALFFGGNAIIDKDGYLTFKKYEVHTDVVIGNDMQHLGGLNRKRERGIDYDSYYLALDDGTHEGTAPTYYLTNVFSQAPVHLFRFAQNYMDTMLYPEMTTIFDFHPGYQAGKYASGELSYRGLPYIDVGDIVTVAVGDTTKRFIFSHHTLNVSGGLSGSSKCYAVTKLDEELGYSYGSYGGGSGGGGGTVYVGGNGINVNGGRIKIKDFIIIDSGTSTTVIEE